MQGGRVSLFLLWTKRTLVGVQLLLFIERISYTCFGSVPDKMHYLIYPFPNGKMILRTRLLWFCIVFLSTGLLLAQKAETIYGDSFSSGDSIYVITNRLPDSTGTYAFLNEVNTNDELAFLKVTFKEPDSLVNTELSSTDFLNEIASIQKDWLFFVHGDSKTYEQAVMRGLDIQYLYNISLIVFSWPSKNPEINGTKNFKNSKKQLIASVDYFEQLLSFMEGFRQYNLGFQHEAKLSLFLHSLGNYYIETHVKLNKVDTLAKHIFSNTIVNAAAVNQDGHNVWLEKFNYQDQIYVISNKQDFNLKGARIFTKDGKQLGEKVELPLAKNATYINFTEAVGFRTPTGTSHTYFIGEVADESNNIRTFYHDILHGHQPDVADTLRFKKRSDKLGYDIIF